MRIDSERWLMRLVVAAILLSPFAGASAVIAAVSPAVTVIDTTPEQMQELVRTTRQAAEAGDMGSQYLLALLHLDGQGVEKAPAEALRWLLRAAEQGHIDAQYRAGLMLRLGEGTTPDAVAALKWLERAASHEDVRAYYAIAQIHRKGGGGVTADPVKARHWFALAAEQEVPPAQVNLGYMWSEGLGGPQDHREAFRWYRRSAEQGNAIAMANMGECYMLGHGVAIDRVEAMMWYQLANWTDMPDVVAAMATLDQTASEAEKQEAKRRAAAWRQSFPRHYPPPRVAQELTRLEASAATGDVASMLALGERYRMGVGVQANQAIARRWLQRASEAGGPNEWLIFANHELAHNTDPACVGPAIRLLQRAAAANQVMAATDLGNLYAEGRRVPRDKAKAFNWYVEAARKKEIIGTLKAGRMAEAGDGVPRDLGQARRWYLQAAEDGFADGQFRLGLLLAAGPATDHVEALAWLEVAKARAYATAASEYPDAEAVIARLKGRLKPAEIQRARAIAEKWLATHPPEAD